MRQGVFFGVVLAMGASISARAAEPTAAEILDKAAHASALGLVGARAEVRLVVDDGHGQKRERRLVASAISLPGGEIKRKVEFTEPADVRGVKLLIDEKPGAAPERLLYLPTQHRVRRVSSSAGGSRFLETDFSYADLDLAGGAGDVSTRLSDQLLDGNKCWVVSTKRANSPYSSIDTWVDQRTGVTLKVIFHANGGDAKVLEVTRVKQVDGRWYAVESVMKTIQAGSKTTLTVDRLDAHAQLSPDDFTQAALERP